MMVISRHHPVTLLFLTAMTLSIMSEATLSEFEEIHDKYCEPDKVPLAVMSAVEACFELSYVDFKVC